MPRYFFHVTDHQRDRDDTGVELDSPDEARRQAVMFLGEFLRDNPGLAWDDETLTVEVTDEARATVFKLRVGVAAR